MTETVYFRPLGFVHGPTGEDLIAQEFALPLKGGPICFTHLQIIKRSSGEPPSVRTIRVGTKTNLQTLIGVDAVEALTQRPHTSISPLLRPGVPALMGILNVTPDSFSDGGAYADPSEAVQRALEMQSEGAVIIDIGGESTRPGAQIVSVEEELDRVSDAIKGAAAAGLQNISVDTRKADVMSAALDLGATMINDVSALAYDPNALAVAARSKRPVVLMHSRGTPANMQDNALYLNTVLDVYDELQSRVDACLQAGIEPENIIIDPGIGFGKTTEDNLALIGNLALFHGLGYPILLGASRKSYIGKLDRDGAPNTRTGGSLAAAAAGFAQGIELVRVHDVAETRQFFALLSATSRASGLQYPQ